MTQIKRPYLTSCIMIVDMQPKFFWDKCEQDLEKKIKYQNQQISKAKMYNMPLFFIEYYSKGSTTLKLDTKDSIILIKNVDDAFSNYSLKQKLDSLEINEINLMGCNANYCILETAISAKNHGYRTYVHVKGILSYMSNNSSLEKAFDKYEKKGIHML